ncbi:GDP-mannose 4,6-dehydratase [Picrophilus oshimae]|uniref:GDP-mannose 4,6-dehydratase n=1 Tax=Picrophilus oshimae TaxID=46632 RepID=UPI003744A64B
MNDPNSFIRKNVFGLVNLLELSRRYDFRNLHISTDEVYGESEADYIALMIRS